MGVRVDNGAVNAEDDAGDVDVLGPEGYASATEGFAVVEQMDGSASWAWVLITHRANRCCCQTWCLCR